MAVMDSSSKLVDVCDLALGRSAVINRLDLGRRVGGESGKEDEEKER